MNAAFWTLLQHIIDPLGGDVEHTESVVVNASWHNHIQKNLHLLASDQPTLWTDEAPLLAANSVAGKQAGFGWILLNPLLPVVTNYKTSCILQLCNNFSATYGQLMESMKW